MNDNAGNWPDDSPVVVKVKRPATERAKRKAASTTTAQWRHRAALQRLFSVMDMKQPGACAKVYNGVMTKGEPIVKWLSGMRIARRSARVIAWETFHHRKMNVLKLRVVPICGNPKCLTPAHLRCEPIPAAVATP
jgi:hypothetical protein